MKNKKKSVKLFVAFMIILLVCFTTSITIEFCKYKDIAPNDFEQKDLSMIL